jgi:5-methylcytosine-specific restriction protein A
VSHRAVASELQHWSAPRILFSLDPARIRGDVPFTHRPIVCLASENRRGYPHHRIPMKIATDVIYRQITAADYFNINKPPGATVGGGGQSYIDIGSAVSKSDWIAFFSGLAAPTVGTGGPVWTVPLKSLGHSVAQSVKIGQRRTRNFNIRSQTLGTKGTNRVKAWDPSYSKFPRPLTPLTGTEDPTLDKLISGLTVYLIRDSDGEFWAGFLRTANRQTNWTVDSRLTPLFSETEGKIMLAPGISFDETDELWPFRSGAMPTKAAAPVGVATVVTKSTIGSKTKMTRKTGGVKNVVRKKSVFKARPEDDVVEQLFGDDTSPRPEEKGSSIRKVKKRNVKAARLLKALYGECQITGKQYVFSKVSDGAPYLEAHHLIPLGKGGADSPANLVVVSAHIHRMLHFADVSDIDLSKIAKQKLMITIDGVPHVVTWHKAHAAKVAEAAAATKRKRT